MPDDLIAKMVTAWENCPNSKGPVLVRQTPSTGSRLVTAGSQDGSLKRHVLQTGGDWLLCHEAVVLPCGPFKTERGYGH